MLRSMGLPFGLQDEEGMFLQPKPQMEKFSEPINFRHEPQQPINSQPMIKPAIGLPNTMRMEVPQRSMMSKVGTSVLRGLSGLQGLSDSRGLPSQPPGASNNVMANRPSTRQGFRGFRNRLRGLGAPSIG